MLKEGLFGLLKVVDVIGLFNLLKGEIVAGLTIVILIAPFIKITI